MTKIYIIGHRNINTTEIGIALQSLNDSLSLTPRFTTNEDECNEYKYFVDKETINIAYKNNAIITVITDDNHSCGILYDDYYNNDILCMTLAEFNMISDKVLYEFLDENNNNILVVWVDSSKNVNNLDIKETEYIEQRLEPLNYLYFCNESVDTIANTVIKYLNSNEDDRSKIMDEYS